MLGRSGSPQKENLVVTHLQPLHEDIDDAANYCNEVEHVPRVFEVILSGTKESCLTI